MHERGTSEINSMGRNFKVRQYKLDKNRSSKKRRVKPFVEECEMWAREPISRSIDTLYLLLIYFGRQNILAWSLRGKIYKQINFRNLRTICISVKNDLITSVGCLTGSFERPYSYC